MAHHIRTLCTVCMYICTNSTFYSTIACSSDPHTVYVYTCARCPKLASMLVMYTTLLLSTSYTNGDICVYMVPHPAD